MSEILSGLIVYVALSPEDTRTGFDCRVKRVYEIKEETTQHSFSFIANVCVYRCLIFQVCTFVIYSWRAINTFLGVWTPQTWCIFLWKKMYTNVSPLFTLFYFNLHVFHIYCCTTVRYTCVLLLELFCLFVCYTNVDLSFCIHRTWCPCSIFYRETQTAKYKCREDIHAYLRMCIHNAHNESTWDVNIRYFFYASFFFFFFFFFFFWKAKLLDAHSLTNLPTFYRQIRYKCLHMIFQSRLEILLHLTRSKFVNSSMLSDAFLQRKHGIRGHLISSFAGKTFTLVGGEIGLQTSRDITTLYVLM